MKNIIKSILVIFVLTSCASNFEEEKATLLKQENKDLVSSFEVENVDANKFKEIEATTPVNVIEKVEVKTKPDKKKKEKVTLGSTLKLGSKKEEVKKEVPVLVEKTDSKEIKYPENYPDLFKQYDLKSKGIWSQFKPIFYKGEQTIMGISYLGVTAGYITILSKGVVKLGDRLAYDFYARFKSRDSYRYFYWLDDYLESFVDKETFLPIKYSLIQREKKQNVDDLQLFDTKKLQNYTWYKRVKEGSNRDEKKTVFIPYYLQDSFSALQFVRGLPLKKGDLYEFPVATRANSWILKLEVLGEESINVLDKEIKAIKIKAETHFPGVLQKSGDIIFWYSADEMKRLLKFQAKVKIGSIQGEIVEYKPGVLVN